MSYNLKAHDEYWYAYWQRQRLQRHSRENHFVQKGFPKKTKNQNREDWRKHKGFAKDQAEAEDRFGCPPWVKARCNRDYRRWANMLLKKGRYDEICWRRDFYDPWMWN